MSSAAVGSRRAGEWIVPGLLILLSIAPSLGGGARLMELSQGAEVTATNARFFAMPLPVILHICSAIPFSILGALLFVPSLRMGRRSWHRAAGRVLAVCGLVAALSGLWMTLVYPWPEGDGAALYGMRLVAGSAMTASILLGVAAALRRDIAAHGNWMIRAYALGMGAGTQVFTHLPWFILMGAPGEGVRAILMGAGWGINVVVAEWIIHRRGRRAPLPGRAPAGTARPGPLSPNGLPPCRVPNPSDDLEYAPGVCRACETP